MSPIAFEADGAAVVFGHDAPHDQQAETCRRYRLSRNPASALRLVSSRIPCPVSASRYAPHRPPAVPAVIMPFPSTPGRHSRPGSGWPELSGCGMALHLWHRPEIRFTAMRPRGSVFASSGVLSTISFVDLCHSGSYAGGGLQAADQPADPLPGDLVDAAMARRQQLPGPLGRGSLTAFSMREQA